MAVGFSAAIAKDKANKDAQNNGLSIAMIPQTQSSTKMTRPLKLLFLAMLVVKKFRVWQLLKLTLTQALPRPVVSLLQIILSMKREPPLRPRPWVWLCP